MTFTGPSKTIVVEPLTVPAKKDAPQTPAPAPPAKVPATR
jgi:hypothetical protein